MEKAQQKLDFFDSLKATDVMYRWLFIYMDYRSPLKTTIFGVAPSIF